MVVVRQQELVETSNLSDCHILANTVGFLILSQVEGIIQFVRKIKKTLLEAIIIQLFWQDI